LSVLQINLDPRHRHKSDECQLHQSQWNFSKLTSCGTRRARLQTLKLPSEDKLHM
jgi:hypothetical protein